MKAAPAPQRAMAVPASAHKSASQKLTASVASAHRPVTPKAIAEKAAAARQILAVQKKPVSQRHGFKANEFIVYPAHGVGRIVGIEEQEIAGMSLELFVITFDKEKLTLRVPTGKLASVGMRKLADEGAGQEGDGYAQRPGAHQAYDVEPQGPGVCREDQLRRFDFDRRGRARSLPLRGSARTVVLRAPALRGRA